MKILADLIRDYPDAHFDQYSDPIAMERKALQATVDAIRNVDLVAHIEAERKAIESRVQNSEDGTPYAVNSNGIAQIDIVGKMTKYGSSFASYQGNIRTRRALRQAANDASVSGIFILIDSPGGSTAGIEDLAADVAAVAARKPTHVYIEDMGASAAYWVASQAARVSAGPSALVGSIGTYGVLYDMSKAYEDAGIKVHVVNAGQFKGAAVEGTPLEEEQLADFRRVIEEINDRFIEGVASGRAMTEAQVRAIADGRVHTGDKARKLGLIDAVETIDDAMSALVERVSESGATTERAEIGVSEMSETNAATLQQLKDALPGASGDFLVQCMEEGLSTAQASKRFIEQQQLEIQQRTQERDDAAKRADAIAKPIGNDPVTGGKDAAKASGGNANWRDEVEQLVQQEMQAKGCQRHRAMQTVLASNPELQQAMVDAANDKAA